ncbi:superoxide dismutase family protein [Gloeobacter violaceus]|uniref:Glr2170 protein n=1 Tax=Gloeobacter violaceus (strain ATCC 29082 / PCC 7421) TaxID=251221 RepID=Q7NIL3_GLOVI|nr:superoxide dismutase family protein [Gloeobacter violaceus]BAC90111.1 glr2170 [Gloeobacter violaceus PCC 7421]
MQKMVHNALVDRPGTRWQGFAVFAGIFGLLCLLLMAVPAIDADRWLQAKIELKNADGLPVGNASLTQLSDGVRVSVQVQGLLPGKYPIHFHSKGKCVAPDFRSSRGVFDTHSLGHKTRPDGQPVPPAGLLPALIVGAAGTGELNALNTDVTLRAHKLHSLLRPGGSALVIHAAHSRQIIACGAVTRTPVSD